MDITSSQTWTSWAFIAAVIAVTAVLIAWMIRYRGVERCEKCHLPAITPAMWDREEYRCRECGTRYRIEIDVWRPREEYRRWVPIDKKAPLD